MELLLDWKANFVLGPVWYAVLFCTLPWLFNLKSPYAIVRWVPQEGIIGIYLATIIMSVDIALHCSAPFFMVYIFAEVLNLVVYQNLSHRPKVYLLTLLSLASIFFTLMAWEYIESVWDVHFITINILLLELSLLVLMMKVAERNRTQDKTEGNKKPQGT